VVDLTSETVTVEAIQKRYGGRRNLAEDWSLQRAREGMRGLLAGWLLAILTIIVAAALADISYAFFSGRMSTADLRAILELLVTPIVGLVGAATGFYFGSQADDPKADS
jgi:hypothetical protein